MLAEDRLVLVLDDFEQNLQRGGGAFLDSGVGDVLRYLAHGADRGRLLITSRYPLPEAEHYLHRVAIGPLSNAESRKLVLRLPKLQELDSTELAKVLRVIGGHHRMLEFLDALAHGGPGRLPQVSHKLQGLLAELNIDPATAADTLDDAVQNAVMLGSRDVFLGDLLDLVRQEALDTVLLQLAASNLPVSAGGLARMLADEVSLEPTNEPAMERAIGRLQDLSLVHRFPNGSAWVHRWTAEGLARLEEGRFRARCVQAGHFRLWRVTSESHSLDDGFEAVRNYLAGEDFDSTADCALACVAALRRFQQTIAVAAFASEVLETLPETHPSFSAIADEEATSYLTLGWTERALRRHTSLLARHERLAQAEPDRADYQRDLVVSLWRLGGAYDDAASGDYLKRAWGILLSLQESGRLSPSDEPFIEQLRELLRERGLAE